MRDNLLNETRAKIYPGILSCRVIGLAWFTLLAACSNWCFSQTASWRNQIAEIDAPRVNQLQQVQSLVDSGQYSEAVELLQKIEDEGEGLLVEASRLPETSPLVMARYTLLSEYCHRLRMAWAVRAPQALELYRSRIDQQASQALEDLRESNEVRDAKKWFRRYAGASSTKDALLWLGDMRLDRGEIQAARDCFLSLAPASRLVYEQPAVPGDIQPRRGSVATVRLLEQCESNPDELVRLMGSVKDGRIPQPAEFPFVDKELGAAAWGRLIWCSLLEGDIARAEREFRVLESLYPEVRVQLSTGKIGRTWVEQGKAWLEEAKAVAVAQSSGTASQFGGGKSRNLSAKHDVRPLDWPRWTHSWLRISAVMDRNPAGLPRVSEDAEALLPYHPVVAGDRVYINDLRKIYALELRTGKTWPVAEPVLPLFDSGLAEENILPLAYPLCGVPRATVAVDNQQLFARMGVGVTGWKEAPREAMGSISFLVGLDLAREGRLIEGFPIFLTGKTWTNCEFEGCPLPVGDRLLVCITERSSVQIRRFVAAFSRSSGKLLWRSMPLAAGMIDGASDANLVSYQMLSYADGTIYLNTNLGAIAALDAMDGELKWLVRYPRNQVDDAAYPESQRFRYRDLTPCLIEKDVIYCAPADRPEIFALDASTGDLLWSTIPEHSADVVHLLSAGDGTLVTAGDRVVWFDTASGRSLASFPSGVAAKPSEGVAEPRGLGRPWCTQDWIYFPSRNQISVLSRKLDRSKTGAQAIVSRDPILLASRASEGGNLVLAERWLLLATPSRLVAFASPDIPKE
jgi:hypothetical protein